MVDYYWLWGGLTCLLVAAWAASVSFVLGLFWMVKAVLREKQKEEMELLARLKRE